jgi:hypothetical protein
MLLLLRTAYLRTQVLSCLTQPFASVEQDTASHTLLHSFSEDQAV